MKKTMRQFYEDDIFGPVEFRDLKRNETRTRAQPSHIVLISDLPKCEKASIRRAIANDINEGM